MSTRNLGTPPSSHNEAPTEADSRREVYRFRKNSAECVVASLSHYHGKLYVDLRVFVAGTGGGESLPTRKGITLSPDLIDELEEALRRLRAALRGEPR